MKMKKVSSLLLLILSSITMIGQNYETQIFEKWTGGTWKNYLKLTNTYDINKYLTNYSSYNWDTVSSSWTNLTKTDYINNSDGTVGQSLSQTWQKSLSSWMNDTRITNTFNGQSLKTTSIGEKWQKDSSKWNIDSRTTYTYSVSNKVKTIVSELWNKSQGVWSNSVRATYTYTSIDSIQTLIYEMWSTNKWVKYSRTNYTYDINNFIANYTYQNWDSTLNTWVNIFQYTYSHNLDGTPSNLVMSNWDKSINSFKNGYRYSYIYTAEKMIQTSTVEIWSNNAWKKSSKNINTYDSNKYRTNLISQNWDTISSVYINSNQSLYSNNSDGSVFQQIDQSWNKSSNSWTNVQRTTFGYPMSSGKEILSFTVPGIIGAATINSANSTVTASVSSNTNLKSLTPTITVSQNATISPLSGVPKDFTNTVGYIVKAQNGTTKSWNISVKKGTNGIEENKIDKNLNIYPNPTSGIFRIDGNLSHGTEILIYNLTGQLIKSIEPDSLKIYNIDDLQKGIYILRIGDLTKKIVLI